MCVVFYLAKRHGDVIQNAAKNFEAGPIQQNDQGFWTSKERHVDRIEAREIAISAGQLKYEEKAENTPLLSEELW